jgi:hypothetical protein
LKHGRKGVSVFNTLKKQGSGDLSGGVVGGAGGGQNNKQQKQLDDLVTMVRQQMFVQKRMQDQIAQQSQQIAQQSQQSFQPRQPRQSPRSYNGDGSGSVNSQSYINGHMAANERAYSGADHRAKKQGGLLGKWRAARHSGQQEPLASSEIEEVMRGGSAEVQREGAINRLLEGTMRGGSAEAEKVEAMLASSRGTLASGGTLASRGTDEGTPQQNPAALAAAQQQDGMWVLSLTEGRGVQWQGVDGSSTPSTPNGFNAVNRPSGLNGYTARASSEALDDPEAVVEATPCVQGAGSTETETDRASSNNRERHFVAGGSNKPKAPGARFAPGDRVVL